MRHLGNHYVWLTRAALWLSIFFGIFFGVGWSQTPLATIQDTLYAADGTRLNGSLIISWSTFDASGLGTVAQQSKTVKVVNGNLYVQLAPNAAATPPANTYTVLYQSDGYRQFTETWTVPATTSPLAVSQVRIGSTSGSSLSATAAGNTSNITESSVTGLVSDLAQRPVKGPSYAAGAVAVIDRNGQLEAAAGSPGSCVMVDGSTGPCGSSGPVYVDREIPGGVVNGTNNIFTLQNSPSGNSLMLFRNGMYMLAGLDYTLIGSSIQFAAGAVPQPADTLVASYRLPAGNAAALTSGSVGAVTTAAAQTVAIPQILCGGAGSSTSVASWTNLGGCDIPASALLSGSRIELRFTFAHTGSGAGFLFETDWGTTAVVSRQASALDTAVAGTADASIGPSGVQVSAQTWGSALPFAAAVQNAPAQSTVHVGFKAMLSASASDTVTLTSYTVLLYPSN